MWPYWEETGWNSAPALIQKCANPESIANHSSPTPSVHSVQDDLQTILTKHNQVFDHSSIGTLKGYKAKVHPQEVIEMEQTRFYKAAPVPYATRRQIDDALDDLLEQGILQPVQFAEYACPIVAVKKPNGGVRICGNYKLTANKVLKLEQYPIPTLEDLLQDLEGGQKYTKLDLSHAYHQIELESN